MIKEQLYQFSSDERIVMPRPVAREIEKLFKQGSMCEKLEEIYAIVRDECPEYVHEDNSNARKFLTGRVIVTMRKLRNGEGRISHVRRKIPITAVMRIVDKLGMTSGKFLQGKNLEVFTEYLNKTFKTNE
jgi:hypothetical protein